MPTLELKLTIIMRRKGGVPDDDSRKKQNLIEQ